MLPLILTVDENVIEEYYDELINVLMKDRLHESTEGCRGIRQSEGKHGEFKVAEPRVNAVL